MLSYFDRRSVEELSGPFVKWPPLLCPVCNRASLEPKIVPVANDSDLYSADEYSMIEGLFHGILACPRTPCGKTYVVVGGWDAELTTLTESEEGIPDRNYYVSYVYPAFPLMTFTEDVPDTVRDLVAAASLVLLSDPSAAANRIRSAIEAVLDNRGIRKFASRSRSNRLTTHQRIKEFEAKNSRAADQLMAMKWIGNIGSHERTPISLSTVLDGIEHFARALELIYDPRERTLDRRAALINQKGKKFKPSDGASNAKRKVSMSAGSQVTT
jgi:hypothetical protein